MNQYNNELDKAFRLFLDRKKLFLSEKEALEDVETHIKKITKGYKFLSDNYIKAITNNPYKRHYKIRQTYVRGYFTKTKRREWSAVVCLLHYIKERSGILYYMHPPSMSDVMIFKSHVFERFVQRELKLEKWESVDLPKDDIMFDVADRLEEAQKNILFRGAPLIDLKTNSAYLPIEGGYLVGNFSVYSKTQDGTPCLGVSYFKTFLSNEMISDEEMENLLTLYRERKEMVNERDKSIPG